MSLFSSLKVPSVQGRRALIVINCQKDAFNPQGPLMAPNPPDFLERIRAVIPHYRKTGTDIIWIKTEVKTLNINGNKRNSAAGKADGSGAMYDLASYLPSSLPTSEPAEDSSRSPGWKSDVRQVSDLVQKLTIDGSETPKFKKHGPSNDLLDEFAEIVDPEKDLILVKQFYSAFDQTPLLMALRMKMVTSIHLCGALSNVSIIGTASDAAQHGFEVSVLEDCMGYRDEASHIEAMQKMADNIGVLGVDSEEIIIEAGGHAPPDADPSLFSGPGASGININDDHVVRPKPKVKQNKVGSRSRWNKENHTGPIAEGDSEVHLDALSPDLTANAFERLSREVSWQVMKHRSGEVPRRVAVQGEIGPDGAVPVYRHPADESPPLLAYSETVRAIRDECSRLLGGQPFNHVLVQLYRDGQDNISEHSDKTLDIVHGSSIVNVSLGAQRKMTLRLKRSAVIAIKRKQDELDDTDEESPEGVKRGGRKRYDDDDDDEDEDCEKSFPARRPRKDPAAVVNATMARESQRVPLPHGSVFVLGPKSNARWLHGIRPDKRLEAERSEEEKAYGGARISLTFRNIGTFTDAGRSVIWGQGAKSKTKEKAGKVLAWNSEESERMIIAFGRENQDAEFDWEGEYGSGFDALDLVVVNRPDESESGQGATSVAVDASTAADTQQDSTAKASLNGTAAATATAVTADSATVNPSIPAAAVESTPATVSSGAPTTTGISEVSAK